MDYNKHCKEKFIERFGKNNEEWLELTDSDYENLINECKTNPLLIEPLKNRIVIYYKKTYMFCILSKKSKIIKTIYPLNKKYYRKIVINDTNYGK